MNDLASLRAWNLEGGLVGLHLEESLILGNDITDSNLDRVDLDDLDIFLEGGQLDFGGHAGASFGLGSEPDPMPVSLEFEAWIRRSAG